MGVTEPRARCRTALGIELRADSGLSGSAWETIQHDPMRGEGGEHKPRKVARIFAAVSASPGKLKPCANDCDDDCTRLDPSLKSTVACMPALTAPFLSLSKTDIGKISTRRWTRRRDKVTLRHIRFVTKA